MKKELIITLISLILTGCAHTQITAYGDNQVTVCGNKAADKNDFLQRAEDVCSKDDIQFSSMSIQATGDQMITRQRGFTGMGYQVKAKKMKCVTFKCMITASRW